MILILARREEDFASCLFLELILSFLYGDLALFHKAAYHVKHLNLFSSIWKMFYAEWCMRIKTM